MFPHSRLSQIAANYVFKTKKTVGYEVHVPTFVFSFKNSKKLPFQNCLDLLAIDPVAPAVFPCSRFSHIVATYVAEYEGHVPNFINSRLENSLSQLS